ncbi:unnamed protein product, partial [Prorocentrum cordatum]
MEEGSGAVYRVGLWNKHDFQKAGAVARAKAPIEALNQKSGQQIASSKKKIARGTKVMDNAIAVGLRALRLGREFSLEQPANAASWRVTAAGCAWGMRGSEAGQGARENWRFLVSYPRAADVLERKCLRGRERRQLEGSRRVADSAKYPGALCRALSREVLAHALVSGITAGASEIEGALKELTEGHVKQAEVMAIEKDTETGDPTDELRKSARLKLQRLHSQLGQQPELSTTTP